MSKPNIVVIMADQLKASALGLYGNDACPTPHLDELAKAGVTYESAVTPHPLCVPARVAFWTGKYPHETGARRNETLMPEGFDHGFRRLEALGYHCALIGKNHCFQDDDYENTFATWLELGHFGAVDNGRQKGDWPVDVDALRALHREQFEGFAGPDRHLQCFTPDCGDDEHTTGAAATAAASFIQEHSKTDAPFALWLSFPAPHEPYIVPKRYYDRIDPALVDLPQPPASWPEGTPARTQTLYRMLNANGREEALRHCVRAYLANSLFVDEAVGRVRAALADSEQLEKAIIVFCADHGDFAGEFNMMVKGGCFYDCLTRVPLVISWPGHTPAGIRDRDPANLIDVLPTLFGLLGESGPAGMSGVSLVSEAGRGAAAQSDASRDAGTEAQPRVAAFSEYGAGMPLMTQPVVERVLAENAGMDAVMQTLRWREAEGRRKMVRTVRYKYVYDPMDPVDELYDLDKDPHEFHNVAADTSYTAIKDELRAMLLDWAIETEGSVPVPLPEEL